MCVCVCIYMCVCVCVCVYIYMCVCVCVCVYIYICGIYIFYICVYRYIYLFLKKICNKSLRLGDKYCIFPYKKYQQWHVLSVKRWISKSYSHCWRVQIHKRCWKTKEFVEPEGFFWRTAGSLTVQNKELMNNYNKKKTFWKGSFQHFYKFTYYFVLWTICKRLLCEISYSGQY